MSVPTDFEPAEDLRANLSLWRIVVLSLNGEHRDYTAVPLNRAVLLLTIPMVFEMIMESLFAMTNIFWVSRFGRDAVAVVGLTEALMTLIYTVAVGLSIVATAKVARRTGERNIEGATQAAGQIVVLGAALSAGIGLVLGYFAGDALGLMGAEPSVVTLGEDFARIMLGGNATVFLIFLINAIFRGAGNAALAMRTLCLANALNIVLGPCCIFGWGPFPELGIAGAAVATNIGRGAGVLYQLWYLAGHHSQVQVRLHHLKPVISEMKTIMLTASKAMMQQLIPTISWIALLKILALFGSAALAGYTIAIRIVLFALVPASGLAGAGATLVGQNLGAGKPWRAEDAVKIAMRYNAVFLGITGAVFIALARPLVGFFTSDPDVLEFGVSTLRIVSLSLPLLAAGMCYLSAFNGAGDTWTPTILNFFCFGCGQLSLAWILAHVFELGPTGVFISVPASVLGMVIWGAVLFKQGRWKQQLV